MPVGPNGELRPDDDVECAHKVFQLAVGEITEEPSNRTLLTLTPVDEEQPAELEARPLVKADAPRLGDGRAGT